MSIDRCVCFNVTLAQLHAFSRATGGGMEEIRARFSCGRGCGLCVPYIREMLRTGRTTFSPGELLPRATAGASYDAPDRERHMTRLPDYVEALDLALRSVAALQGIEEVALSSSSDRVLARDICADRDLPPFDRAQMDGYALRASEFIAGRPWNVAHTIAAGASPMVHVPARACVAIATGAALPAGLDAVIQHELSDRGDLRGRPVHFQVETVRQWQAVHRRGADALQGQVLIKAGTLLRPHQLGIAAAVGCTKFQVRQKPRAAILTSGDEVLPPDTPSSDLQPHQIRNSNAIMVAAMLRNMGAEPLVHHHLPDQRDVTIESVRQAIRQHDLVIKVGGVSAGERDHFPDAFDDAGVQASLRGASIQPGRPILVGRAPSGAVIVGLPGNPVSSLACACLFIWPIVRVMLGIDAALPWRTVELAEAVRANPHRRAFRPAQLVDGDRVIVPRWAGSGDLAHTAATHGLLELPVQDEPVKAGAGLRFLPWP